LLRGECIAIAKYAAVLTQIMWGLKIDIILKFLIDFVVLSNKINYIVIIAIVSYCYMNNYLHCIYVGDHV